MSARSIPLQPILRFPRVAQVGRTYLLTVDARHSLPPEQWPYEQEEYPLTCLLESLPWFDHRPLGEPTLLVHRFGGTYGEIRFQLTAGEQAGEGRLRLIFVNESGLPVHTALLPEIRVERGEGEGRGKHGEPRAWSERYLLQLNPSAIRLRQVPAKYDYPVKVELQNLGSIDLEIASIESDQPWLTVTSRARSFTLLRPGESRGGELSPTSFAQSYIFTVVCKPQSLPVGGHQGRVTIRPVGHTPKVLEIEIDVIHPKPHPDYIGIDLGITNSVVAVFDQVSHGIELVDDGVPPSPLIPSALVFDDADTYVIGKAALNSISVAPERSVRSLQRIMDYDHDCEFFGRRFSSSDLLSCVLRKLVQFSERKLLADMNDCVDIKKAIITVPATYSDSQIRCVLEACNKAGLDTEEEKVRQAATAMNETPRHPVDTGIILDKPSAIIFFYLHIWSELNSEAMQIVEREEGLRILVIDYNEGALDTSVAKVTRLENHEVGLRILSSISGNKIGGDSIDLILMRELLERCKQHFPRPEFDTELIRANFKDLDTRREREGWRADTWHQILWVRAAWKDLSEVVKLQFSEREQVEIEVQPDLIISVANGKIHVAPRAIKLSISRTEIERWLYGILDECKRLIDSALNLAGLSSEQIDYIVHADRQSLLPIIRKRVREVFSHLPAERDILDLENLRVCAAKGAALYGWMRSKLGDPEARIHLLSEGRRLPYSYGVEKFTSIAQREFDEFISRGTAYPVSVEKTYGPETIPRSGYLNLRIYQNSGTSKRILGNPEVSLLGQATVNTLADGERGCVVRFVIDANRKLQVFADGQEVMIQHARRYDEESSAPENWPEGHFAELATGSGGAPRPVSVTEPKPRAVEQVECPTCYSMVDAGPRCQICGGSLEAI